jgi:hypothetical protein
MYDSQGLTEAQKKQDTLDYLTTVRRKAIALRDVTSGAQRAGRFDNKYAYLHIEQVHLLAQQALIEVHYATLALEGGR